MEEEGEDVNRGDISTVPQRMDGVFPHKDRTGSGHLEQHEETHTGAKVHSTSRKNETAGAQKETAPRN